MKALTTLLLALTLVMVLPANAQHQQHHQQQGAMQQADSTRDMMGMMQGGMMQMHMMEQMMQNPLHRSAMLVHVLPTMQEPLNLSDDQVARLKERTQQFKEQKQAHQQQMMVARQQLQELLASEDAAPEQVRSLLEEAAVHHAQMQALSYETATQMKGVLSAEQRTQLAEMKPMQLHHHMMMNMTMMEMMQAMHGNMMSGGMMPGSMMQNGMMNMMKQQ